MELKLTNETKAKGNTFMNVKKKHRLNSPKRG